jgi:hypothetical protein
LLLTTILANPINLGLTKMAEARLGTSLAKLSWLVAWLTLCQCRPDRPGGGADHALVLYGGAGRVTFEAIHCALFLSLSGTELHEPVFMQDLSL